MEQIRSIVLHTSHHTHQVIGSGSGDPQKYDPAASRETLDHSVPCIFAVALEDGVWHHEWSYAPERAQRPGTVELWQRISTVEGPEWTRRYHDPDPERRAFGGRAVVTLVDGTVIEDELAVADAHPAGARPFDRSGYVAKFRTLAEGTVAAGDQDRLLRMPGAINPYSARLIQEAGFEALYLSGAVLAAELALPEIGLTSSTEIAARAQQIARVTDLPALTDADTGFGEPMNAARTVQLMEDAGLAGLHLEDQVNPKRCGHLDGKTLVGRAEMVRKVRAAADARRDPDFLLMARTDARGPEGLEAAIDRAKAYVDAGADAVFPEALADEGEFEAFRAAVDVPLLANMTEFGKGPLLDTATLESLGYNIALYPVTLFRLAMGAVEDGLRTLAAEGTQQALLPRMQTRSRLYEVLGYEEYGAFDSAVFDFTLPPGA